MPVEIEAHAIPHFKAANNAKVERQELFSTY